MQAGLIVTHKDRGYYKYGIVHFISKRSDFVEVLVFKTLDDAKTYREKIDQTTYFLSWSIESIESTNEFNDYIVLREL